MSSNGSDGPFTYAGLGQTPPQPSGVNARPGNIVPEVDNWKHRSAEMRCRTCMYFVPKLSGEYEPGAISPGIGRCRRHAPTMGGWPAMYATDWCGDHKIDEEKL